MALELGDRAFELRARNNYASVLYLNDPLRASAMMREAAEVARDIGDRQMYRWMLGNNAANAFSEGQRWDEMLQELDEALAHATLPADRVRLLVFVSLIAGERGESVDAVVDELLELTHGREGADMRFSEAMAQAHRAFLLDDVASVMRYAKDAFAVDAQNPEVPASLAFRAAVVANDPDLIQEAAEMVRSLPATGAWSLAFRRHVEAALAGLEGRTAEAAAEHVAAHDTMVDLGQLFDAAILATLANLLLPGRPELRAIGERARETLTRLRARVWLRRLEAALDAPVPTAAGAPSATSAEVAA